VGEWRKTEKFRFPGGIEASLQLVVSKEE